MVEERYLTLERPTVDAVYNALLVRIREENLTREGREIPVPHRSSVYRIVSQLEPYEVVKGRYGKAFVDRKFKIYGRGVVATRPLERVEIDSTRMDLMVVHEDGTPMGRPTFTVAIDCYTKSVLGFYVSFEGEGAHALLECLKHAVLPKIYVRDKYPEIKHSWDAHGLPELVVFDNGAGQHSSHLEDACRQLGISMQFCPVRQPWFKARVERHFKSLNTMLLHGIPGTTFSDIFERGEYEPEKHAIVSFETLLEILHRFVVDVYQQEGQGGIKDVPARLWRESIQRSPQKWAPHPDDLRILFGHVEDRKLQHYGIDFAGLRYSDPALEPLYRRRKKGRRGVDVKIKYDPSDLNVIHVYDEDAGEF